MTSLFKYLTYMMASVRACAVEIKPGVLRVACFFDEPVWTRILFARQDGNFQSKKRLFNRVYWRDFVGILKGF